jgi:hypothetical protein
MRTRRCTQQRINASNASRSSLSSQPPLSPLRLSTHLKVISFCSVQLVVLNSFVNHFAGMFSQAIDNIVNGRGKHPRVFDRFSAQHP